jgi:microcystin degradation protein MlrC
MTRIAIGGIVHETNTFAPNVTTYVDFARQSLHTGSELVSRWHETQTALGGVLQGLARLGFQPVPLLYTAAMPSGLVARDAYEPLRDELIERLKAAMPMDGVLLVLHGAMCADGYLDCEGDILERARAVVGRDVPIVCTLDMHGNLSDAMVAAVDALVAFDQNPHLDTFERGLEAADIMRRMISEGLRTAKALVRPPILLTALTTWTAKPPLSAVHERGHEFERNPQVVNVSVMGGFAYADTPFTGMSMLVTTDGDADLAKRLANELRDLAWVNREAARHKGLPISEAMQRVIGAGQTTLRGPIVLADVGDNVGGGSPGDGTVLLHALLDARVPGAVMTMADVEAVTQAAHAGEGATIELWVGGKQDDGHGKPVHVRGFVERITDGRFTIEGTDHFAQLYGRDVQMGRCAIVQCEGLCLLLTERKTPPGDLAQLRSQGIIPELQRVIVVKSAVAFRGAYQRIASDIIEVDTPGLVTANLARFTYKHLPRPIFPLDEIVNSEPLSMNSEQ